jgi:Type II secretion system (T2SS), protein L
MESRNHLGIYLKEDRATVVCLTGQGRESKLRDCFSVDLEGEEQPSQQALADHLARLCAERGFKSATATVALDCALFMQHAVHSDFSDVKKIAATVRFDTEESLATDVSDMAVAFRVASTDEDGANLDVFTAERSVLSDILLSLQGNGIDPAAVVTDAYCLSRYVDEGGTPAGTDGTGTVYALLSDSRGYFVANSDSDGGSMMRAFLIGPTQDRQTLLSREALVTTALAGTGDPAGRLCVFDGVGTLAAQDLAASIPFQVEDCDLAGMRGLETSDLAEGRNAVDVAIAYGAALSLLPQDSGANFRNDHMPYLGKKVRLQRAIRFLSVSLTLLLLALGVYAQTQLMRIDRRQTAQRTTLEPDYLAMMPGAQKLPSRMTQVVQRLESALRQLDAEKGRGDPKSLSAKMTLVLQALNACAAQTDLEIDVVTLSAQNIMINGDTSSRPNTLKVFEAMGKAGLKLTKQGWGEKGGRDTFTVTVEPQKTTQ